MRVARRVDDDNALVGCEELQEVEGEIERFSDEVVRLLTGGPNENTDEIVAWPTLHERWDRVDVDARERDVLFQPRERNQSLPCEPLRDVGLRWDDVRMKERHLGRAGDAHVGVLVVVEPEDRDPQRRRREL